MSVKILVIGTGAIGSFYAAKLSQAGAEVAVVCRSDYEEVKKNGIFVKSYEGDFHFTPHSVIKNVDQYQDCADFIIVATKVLPSIDIAQIVKPVINNNTSLVLIQNGIHIEEPIIKAFPNQHLISALAFICVSKIAPATISHQAFGRIVIGDYPQGSSAKTKILFDLFNQSQTPCVLAENIKLERWKKLIWNIGFNPTSVLTGGADTSKMLTNPATKVVIEKIMQEVVILAKADGCFLPEDIIEKNINDTLIMPPYKTSMLLDFEAKREMEVEAILGNALRFAESKNIDVPYIKTFYGLLSCY
jgi:2-dehydropantoate 2-reductase